MSYHTKLVADAVFSIQRPLLDAWSAAHGLVVTCSAVGNVHLGFHQLVQIIHSEPHWVQDDEVLSWITSSGGLLHMARAGALLHPPGVVGMVLRVPLDNKETERELLVAAGRRFLPYKEFLRQDWVSGRRPGSDSLALNTAEPPSEGEPCLMGLMWRVAATATLRTYVAIKIAELAFGSDDHHSALRPLRDSGEIYSIISRYLFETDVFVLAGAGTYSPSKYHRAAKTLINFDYLDSTLGHAKKTFASRLIMTDSHVRLHRLGSYIMIDPDVTEEYLVELANEVTADEIRSILSGQQWPLIRRIDEHGIR
jgi:hypothetical protein